MPSLSVKLYSIFFKLQQKQKLHNLIQSPLRKADPFGITSRHDEPTAPSNPSFSSGANGIASKDVHIDPFSALCLRIFLPDSVLEGTETESLGGVVSHVYGGYSPSGEKAHKRLPVMVQFHGGGFVTGSNDSVGNDAFCRRIAKACDAIVVAVGYRLAPESKFPAAFDDGLNVLNWLGKQGNLAEYGKRAGYGGRRNKIDSSIFDGFGASVAEPWLAAHADLSRCVLLGVSSGANIADYVSRRVLESGNFFSPVKVVAQVLMYPFFIGSIPTKSETKLANSYFYDKALSMLAWKLFLPEQDFSLDHPAANPLTPWRRPPPLKFMPPTLTVVAEHDWMRDRAIAYSKELRRANVDAPLLEYKDAVHEFATMDMLLQTPQAKACSEDIAIWVKKYISLGGNELSY